jgi:hypothetical protein
MLPQRIHRLRRAGWLCQVALSWPIRSHRAWYLKSPQRLFLPAQPDNPARNAENRICICV